MSAEKYTQSNKEGVRNEHTSVDIWEGSKCFVENKARTDLWPLRRQNKQPSKFRWNERTTALSLARHKYILDSRGERWRQLRGSSLKRMRLHNGRNKIVFTSATPKIFDSVDGQIAWFLILVMMFVHLIPTWECLSFTCAWRKHHSRENRAITD